ncbi:SGNH hydrolase [Pseudovirgaria hyperparasitica]|uniref:SGNH hydrolase n=1 Tax=Pseudovirgaria hyperparasitica TaxID=470096 RepID=A0A6A6W2G9_9PEZI|nr:SGNH hydrolase [Pseudovirgaria hyperparasitica]KAF2756150.1 SGNH hydrolase [Pseudovirgaria hyperparasitica]
MSLSFFALWASLVITSYCLPSDITPATSLLRRNNPDPADLSWIKSWASAGDSYSAGIGAGKKYGGWGDYFCSRYDQSFPVLINTDPRLGSSKGRKFTYRPCSGATIDGITSQVKGLPDASQDLITLSGGGNDANFKNMLNECVFQWLSNADPLTSFCQRELDKAQATIDSADFHSKLDTLIDNAKKKLRYGGQIIYVGYAQFFGQDSKQCDDITWAFWYEIGKREYLTQDKRRRMNKLVTNMNKVLSDAVGRASGDLVTFVDYNKYFAEGRGRFCEDAYKETNPNRYGLLYYEWNTDDNADETDGFTTSDARSPSTFTPSLVMNGTFEGSINDFVRQNMAKHPDWHINMPVAQGAPPRIDTIQATEEQLAIGYSAGVLPDSYGRVFHPRPNGHQLIANLVLYQIEANSAKKIAKHWPAEEITRDTCPADKGSLSPTTLPPVNVDLGILTCNVQHDDGDEMYYFPREAGLQAIANFCSATHSAGMVLGSNMAVEGVGIIVEATANDKLDGCPSTDASTDRFEHICNERLINALDNCKFGWTLANYALVIME